MEFDNIISHLSLTNDLKQVHTLIMFRYVGSEYGDVSVLKYDVEDRKITQLPYYVPATIIAGTIYLFL